MRRWMGGVRKGAGMEGFLACLHRIAGRGNQIGTGVRALSGLE